MANTAKQIERFEKRVKTIEEHLANVKQEVDIDKRQKEKDKILEDISLVKEEISEHLEELKKDVENNDEEIKKLENLSEKVESFSSELDWLKNEILKKEEEKNKEKENDKKEEEEWTPSFFANVFYGGLIANTLGKLPWIGKSISSWTEKKVKESAQDNADEKSGKKEKPWFLKRAWNTIFWSGIATGALWLGRKLIPDSWAKEVKSWLPWTEEAKAKKEQEEKIKKEQEEKDKLTQNASWAEIQQNWSENQQDWSENLPEDASFEWEHNTEGEKIELTPEEQQINTEAEQMYSEWYSELYILMKMYGLWYIPRLTNNTVSTRFGGRFMKIIAWRPLEKMGEIRADLRARIIQSIWINRDIALQLKIDAIAKKTPNLAKDFDTKANRLIAIIDDLEKWKIKSLDDLRKTHPEILKELGDRRFVLQQKKYLESIKVKSLEEFNRMAAIESDLKSADQTLKQLKSKAQYRLQTLNNQAKNANPQTKKKIEAEAQKIIQEYNKTAVELETKTGLQIAHMNPTEVERLSKIGVVDGMVKFNWKINSFVSNKKTVKFLIGFSLFSLASDYAKWEKTGKQVALEVGDAWIGMIPFAGGAYDIWTSITWEGIAGNLSTWDRWLRGVVWWASLVLDVAGLFTFGAGNAAAAGVRAAVKWWTKIAKVWKTIVKWAEIVTTGTKVLGLGFLWYNLVAGAAPIVYEWVDKQTTSDIEVTPDVEIQ